ncbi:4'-phosphopantetheinyl transferase superfamily protein [Methylocella sp. CPCC 101449]|uniref:4'-phosphopantetheinyl transferase family protein n=1 Tax=Methylocella sp. CPCC 101449 TaxID=2987531 RepID=UPI002890964F|nr:4'-phosphopantetheinyl transferase superfamily protein [Methylocella sp. CPCC 101449]MDT2019912.1 4'-phosphopantetheinyl transferase superfamily protein [Methylocella sp. CPCC 101449]
MPAGIEWIFADGIDRLAQPDGDATSAHVSTRVLAVDLDDPRTVALQRLALLPSDLADEARPGATDRRYFRARRAALRALVAWQLGVTAETIEIAYDAAGAPRVVAPVLHAVLPGVLAAPSPFISVSARGSRALLAVSASPVGVDFEPDTTAQPILDVLHPHERAELATLDGAARDRRFLEIWTAKEAYLKALGDGLTRDPATIAVSSFAASSSAAGLRIDDTGETAALLQGEIRHFELNGVAVVASCIVRAN